MNPKTTSARRLKHHWVSRPSSLYEQWTSPSSRLSVCSLNGENSRGDDVLTLFLTRKYPLSGAWQSRTWRFLCDLRRTVWRRSRIERFLVCGQITPSLCPLRTSLPIATLENLPLISSWFPFLVRSIATIRGGVFSTCALFLSFPFFPSLSLPLLSFFPQLLLILSFPHDRPYPYARMFYRRQVYPFCSCSIGAKLSVVDWNSPLFVSLLSSFSVDNLGWVRLPVRGLKGGANCQ